MSDENQTEQESLPSFSVFDLEFDSPKVFKEGHVLTSGEAAHLTQTFKENLSNAVRACYKRHLKTANENSEDEIERLAGPQLTAFKKEAGKIIAEYEMQERTATGSTRDPVTAKAHTLARKWLVDALRKAGTSLKAARQKNPEGVEEKIALRAAQPDMIQMAKELLAKEAEIGAKALEEINIDDL